MTNGVNKSRAWFIELVREPRIKNSTQTESIRRNIPWQRECYVIIGKTYIREWIL